MKVYLDNAATTPLDEKVLAEILPVLKGTYGNPSSIHTEGRKARSLIEISRKKVAEILNTSPSEIFFTSGGTEADNMAIWQSVKDLGVKKIITSPIEHHAVLHTIEMLDNRGEIAVEYVQLLEDGHVDLNHLETLLVQSEVTTLVSLMHANNEIGNLLDIKKVGELCREHRAYFHSDTVQTVGHYNIDLQDLKVDFITGSAHKFHGPKGVGFLYINNRLKISPLIYGGAQERNMRGGTENIYGIVGLAKALEIATTHMEEHKNYISGLKDYMIDQLRKVIPEVNFNGAYDKQSLYTVLSVCLPESEKGEMLLFSLDIAGISASAGSACSSGTDIGSHVLRAIKTDMKRPSIRFSFSKYNTKTEIDYCVEKLREVIN